MVPKKPDYLPSSAHIYGIAVIVGVTTAAEKPRTVFLEAGFWNGDNTILGLFRYFNENALAFQPKQKCFIHSTVSFVGTPSMHILKMSLGSQD